nr:hypothetical protein [Singulisphaera sp. GP187]
MVVFLVDQVDGPTDERDRQFGAVGRVCQRINRPLDPVLPPELAQFGPGLDAVSPDQAVMFGRGQRLAIGVEGEGLDRAGRVLARLAEDGGIGAVGLRPWDVANTRLPRGSESK